MILQFFFFFLYFGRVGGKKHSVITIEGRKGYVAAHLVDINNKGEVKHVYDTLKDLILITAPKTFSLEMIRLWEGGIRVLRGVFGGRGIDDVMYVLNARSLGAATLHRRIRSVLDGTNRQPSNANSIHNGRPVTLI